MVYRVCVEKKPGLAPECASLLSDCRSFLDLKSLENVRIWNRYDVEGIDETLFAYATNTVFSEPQLDLTSGEIDASGAAAGFAVKGAAQQQDTENDGGDERYSAEHQTGHCFFTDFTHDSRPLSG